MLATQLSYFSHGLGGRLVWGGGDYVGAECNAPKARSLDKSCVYEQQRRSHHSVVYGLI